jgi:hypothetical protein
MSLRSLYFMSPIIAKVVGPKPASFECSLSAINDFIIVIERGSLNTEIKEAPHFLCNVKNIGIRTTENH